MSNFAEDLRFLHKLKRIRPLQNEYEEKVIAKAKEVRDEIRELRSEAVKPFPTSKEINCTNLERQLIEKMGEYRKMCQREKLARIDYYLGTATDNAVIEIGCKASNLLEEANHMADMLLKERYVVIV